LSLVFADTLYWVAVTNRRDQWHGRALEVSAALPKNTRILTTDEVLVEFLNAFAAAQLHKKEAVASFVQRLFVEIEVVPQTHGSLLNGLELYAQRLDQGYSLTDCISMRTMRDYGVRQALTHDRHFAQEGFEVLL